MKYTAQFQIGKNGITDGVITSLATAFKTHKVMRISCLKSSGRTKETIKSMAEELKEKLAAHTPYRFEDRIIGFTIVLNRFAQK